MEKADTKRKMEIKEVERKKGGKQKEEKIKQKEKKPTSITVISKRQKQERANRID